jgi:putative ABC transport system ATP-binding protein
VTSVRLQDVTSVFDAGGASEIVAVAGVTERIEAREVTVITGPSGSGKTTLLALIGCMARPTSGRIFVGEREITSLPERFLTDVRRRTFGFVFQQFHLLRGITTLENVMLPAYPLGEPRAALIRRARTLLDQLGIASREHARADRLSGGEAQRVAIARALVNDPAVIIADEPTAHLDTARSLEFMEIVAGLRASGKTVIIASHDPAVFDSPVVDRTLCMRDGRLETAPP